MNIRKFATITVLVLSSFAATNVAPTKAELESMYDKAFRDFNANDYPQALKELDAIDARQPDLAESQNLRGVILMRQAQYDQAEVSLQKALATDPKFWNARFNLAEIPFLRKDWAEARKRFDALLQGDAAELQGEAAQLIQYKILLTYLLQGNDNMVDSILAKFELSPETPAANYSRVAIALQHKSQKEATDLLATAEKNFSPQLNKLFAESLYEVGWLQKPVGQARAALELTSASDRVAKGKAAAAEKYEQAEQAFQQFDLTAARKLVEEADAADPNQAATINLHGEILLAQSDFDGAESAFKRALKINPKLAEAHYNLAQIPFKKKEYSKARERFEALFNATPASGGDKNQTSQIIKFKIYLTLLLEGKDSRAQKVMEQFKFTGDTPALYYAQAAWEFKHNNAAKGNLWIVSARKIYSPALNLVFSDSFYDLGWLQRQQAAAASTEIAKSDTPAIEPSPIPATTLASEKTDRPLTDASSVKSSEVATGTDLTKNATPSLSSPEAALAKEEKTVPAPVASPKVEMPVALNAPTAASSAATPQPEQKPVVAPTAAAAVALQVQSKNPAAATPKVAPPSMAKKSVGVPPAAATSKAARDPSRPSLIERLDHMTSSHTLLVGVLLLAGVSLLAWVVIAELRRRVHGPDYHSQEAATKPHYGGSERQALAGTVAVPAPAPVRLSGGPPQVSLRLKASEPSVRRAAVPFSKVSRPLDAGGSVATAGNGSAAERFAPRETSSVHEPEPISAPTSQSIVENVAVAEVQSTHDLTAVPGTEGVGAPSEWEFTPAKTPMAPSEGDVSQIPPESPVSAKAPAVIYAPPAFEGPDNAEPSTMFVVPPPIEAISEPPKGEELGIESLSAEEPAAEPLVANESAVESKEVDQPEVVPKTVEEEPELVSAATEEEPEVGSVAIEEEPELVSAATEEKPELASVATEDEPEVVPVATEEEPEVVSAATEEEPELASVATEEEPELASVATEEEPEVVSATIEEEPELVSAATEEEPELVSVATEAEPEVVSAAIEEEPGVVSATTEEEPEVVSAATEEMSIDESTFSESVGEPIPIPSEVVAKPALESAVESFHPEAEPVAQGQPIPYQIPAFATDAAATDVSDTETELLPIDRPEEVFADAVAFNRPVEHSPFVPQIISTEPLAQPTIPAIMPQTIQPTPVPIRTAPATGAGPQPTSGGMQTAVQLTFSFEIASLQLTPSFKMGTLQLKPTSKIVTMRLAPSQQPQPAMNLQVTFEISSVQLAGNSIGIIRLVPSQQQRPGVINTPSFNIAGLQLLSGADSAVQLTPSQQGQASVHVTGRFQIATVEFSPSFEIASIVLNSTSKNVSVQLPGAGPSAVEGAPVFEITSVQLAGNGDIGLMQLNAQGLPPKPA